MLQSCYEHLKFANLISLSNELGMDVYSNFFFLNHLAWVSTKLFFKKA